MIQQTKKSIPGNKRMNMKFPRLGCIFLGPQPYQEKLKQMAISSCQAVLKLDCECVF